jgi:uncharacterized lipoprotein YddW (UPF0748 family)
MCRRPLNGSVASELEKLLFAASRKDCVMRTSARFIPIAFFLSAAVCVAAEDAAVLNVEGRGVEGRPPYRGGGAVRFLDASIAAQVVHYAGEKEIALPLKIEYEVREPAPIRLTSRMGTEYWRLYGFDAGTMAAMYTDEKIDLSQPGQHTAQAIRAWFGSSYGPPPKSGLVGIRGRYYFLIEPGDGPWIDVTDPPAFFDQAEIGRKLTFTLADLSKFRLAIPEIQSTWQAGGPLRVRVAVTDAAGETLPVIGAPATAAAAGWQAGLSAEWSPLGEPTGWLRGTLPDVVPSEVTVESDVTFQTPGGLEHRKVAATFHRGDGLVSPESFRVAEQGYELPRNAQGKIRETRAVWTSTSDFDTPEGVEAVVDRCTRARLNVIVPDIFVRNVFLASSELMPPKERTPEGFDPLGRLVEKAHAAGLEVHPWFCVTYRDSHFRRWFREKYEVDVDMVDRDGGAIDLGADVHRPEYRQFVVDLMIGIARDYPVDGIHLDYIRSMGRCYCDACRKEFAERFGKPLVEASDEEWVDWQREAIGDIVRRTAEGVRRVRPAAKMSAAVFASMPGGAAQGQDPAGWAAAGWIDVVMPMDYQMQSLQVRSDERQFLAALADDDKLATGLSLYMRSGGDVSSRPPELVRQQIELVRRLGIHGYCLFAFGHLSDGQLTVLRDDLNREPAVPYFR